MNGSFGNGWIPPVDGTQEQVNAASYGQCDQMGNLCYANFQQGWGTGGMGVDTYPHQRWRQHSWKQSSESTGTSSQRPLDSQMIANGLEYIDIRCFNGTRQELQHDGRYSQQQPFPHQLGGQQFQQWNGQTRGIYPQFESSRYMLATRWGNNGNVWRGYPNNCNGDPDGLVRDQQTGQPGRDVGPFASGTNGCYDQTAGDRQHVDNHQQRNGPLFYPSGARSGWEGQQMVQNNSMNSEQQQQQQQQLAYQGQQSNSYFHQPGAHAASSGNGEFCGSNTQSNWMYQSNQADEMKDGVLDCYQSSTGLQQQAGQFGQPEQQAQESFADVVSSGKNEANGEGGWNPVLVDTPGAAVTNCDTKGSDNSSGDKVEGRDSAAQMTGHSNLEAHSSDNPIGEGIKPPVSQWPNKCLGSSAGYHSWQSVDVKDKYAYNNAENVPLSADNRLCQQQSSEHGDGSSGGKTMNSGSNQPLSDSGHCDAKVEQTESGHNNPGYPISNAMKRSKRSGRHAAKAMVLMMEEEESKEDDADRDYLLKHNMRKAKALAVAAGRVAMKEMGDLEESANAHMDDTSDEEADYE